MDELSPSGYSHVMLSIPDELCHLSWSISISLPSTLSEGSSDGA
jgi:hypothetical protein